MKRSARNFITPGVWPLESRRLLASTLADRLLTVDGDGNNNEIILRASGASDEFVLVTIDGVDEQFDASAVQRVFVNARGGRDRISYTLGVIAELNIAIAVLNGNGGGDTIFCSSPRVIIRGGTGNDTLQGGRDGDQIFGDSGNDSIVGDDGDDSIESGEGDDSVVGGSGNDSLKNVGGNDTLEGTSGDDLILDFSSGNSLIDGGSGRDALNGGPGSDTIFGRGGNDGISDGGFDQTNTQGTGDVLSGGSGRDVLRYVYFPTPDGPLTITTGDGLANDGLPGEGDNVAPDFEIFILGENDDRIDLTNDPGSHEIRGRGGDDTIIGGPGADLIFGNEGSDSLTGGAGEDRMYGGFGNDTLIANDGVADIVNGREDNDTAIVDAVFDTVSNVETVT